jgi:exodeoxyribonuclease V alpha subunit
VSDGTVIADTVDGTACVFLGGLYRAEQVVAERLRRLVDGPLPWAHIDPEKALPWIERRIGLALAESQIAAIRLALQSKVLVITGGPGVGKTTIVNAILRILSARGVAVGGIAAASTGHVSDRAGGHRFGVKGGLTLTRAPSAGSAPSYDLVSSR